MTRASSGAMDSDGHHASSGEEKRPCREFRKHSSGNAVLKVSFNAAALSQEETEIRLRKAFDIVIDEVFVERDETKTPGRTRATKRAGLGPL